MKKWFVVLTVAVLLGASLSGCSSKPTTTNTPPTTTTTQTTATGGYLSQIMQSAGAVKEMSFDTTSTMTNKDGTTTSTSKLYMSNGKMRMEMVNAGMKIITIKNAQGDVYMYYPDTKTAMKISTPQNTPAVPNKWAGSGDTTGYKIIGSETKNGYDCWVVQYTDPANASNSSKMWLRKDIGMPVRIESSTADGTTVMEYSNYNLGPQDASLFELPAGTTVTAMPSAPNLPNLPQ